MTSHNGKLIQLVFHSVIFQVKSKAELMKSARLEGRYEEFVRVEGYIVRYKNIKEMLQAKSSKATIVKRRSEWIKFSMWCLEKSAKRFRNSRTGQQGSSSFPWETSPNASELSHTCLPTGVRVKCAEYNFLMVDYSDRMLE